MPQCGLIPALPGAEIYTISPGLPLKIEPLRRLQGLGRQQTMAAKPAAPKSERELGVGARRLLSLRYNFPINSTDLFSIFFCIVLGTDQGLPWPCCSGGS